MNLLLWSITLYGDDRVSWKMNKRNMNPISQSLKAIFPLALELTNWNWENVGGSGGEGVYFVSLYFCFSRENFKQKDYIYKRII